MKKCSPALVTACLSVGLLLPAGGVAAEGESKAATRPPRAARSVHLRYQAPPASVFYNEVTVEESTSSTYFCVCGFNSGYFGIQELRPGREKVVIFSVWDPGRQDDPNSVDPEKRVELLHQGEGVRIGRFGGEGTGGQSFFNYAWQIGETCRFMVHATTNGNKTAFAGYFFRNDTREWKHLVTFRTITGGKPLGGYYSFVEDFRRDGRSVNERRRARFGNGWVKTLAGAWTPLTKATFTGDNTPLFNIDAGVAGMDFFLATGGPITNSIPLRSPLTRNAGEARAPAVEAVLAAEKTPASTATPSGVLRGYRIPLLDLAGETNRQIIVDREPGQYLGHPTTVLLEDGRTLLAVYPKGHGKGALILKRSRDGGLTWSERLPVPDNWATSRETPTIHRVVDKAGRKRLIVWSGLHPARLAVSEDDGNTWSPLAPAGEWGGIVVMGCVEALKTGAGEYLAMFHDDGRYFTARPEPTKPPTFTLFKTFSRDGGLTWSFPEAVFKSDAVHLCEPGLVRSPDGKQLAVLLRENRRVRNSHLIVSSDEGRTWSEPRELPGALTGDRHTARYAPDGRLFISFRDTTLDSPTSGDWVAWVGTYDDVVAGREGQYRVRLMDNHVTRDCAYPGVEVLPDGTFVTTTYGHWVKGESPFIVSVRLKLAELDARAAKR